MILKQKINDIVKELTFKSHTNPLLCMQCLSCSNGCPYVDIMDVPPHKIMRLLQYGLIEETLRTSTIWICVGCNTCSAECPMSIDIPAIFDFLKHKAIQTNTPPKEMEIFKFHTEVLNSIKKYGRTHKLGIMIGFKLKTGTFLKDVDIGLKMLFKGKLEILPHSISSNKDLKKLFNIHEI